MQSCAFRFVHGREWRGSSMTKQSLILLIRFVGRNIFTIEMAKLYVHLWQVFPFEQLERLRNLGEVYESPEPKPFKPRVDPSSWLADEQHRDQFVLRYSEPHPSGKLVRVLSYFV